jgi:hypothetical protein
MPQHLCPLCLFPGKQIPNDIYYSCQGCGAIFLDKNKHLSLADEKLRYESHNNDINDERYRKFVSPVTLAVSQEQTTDDVGLDFGSGTGPVVSAILKENGYNISQYDPFFANDQEKLTKQYNYIACCEVAEHFRDPKKEFQTLKNLLLPNGSLYIMTDIYNDKVDFKTWHYRRDSTHVFFYSQQSFEYIKKTFKFKNLRISGRLVVLDN